MVLAIAADQPEKLQRFKKDNNLTMTLLIDQRWTTLNNYNVFMWQTRKDHPSQKMAIAVPSTFLINIQGQIAWSYVGFREDRPPIDLILRAIDENLLEKK